MWKAKKRAIPAEETAWSGGRGRRCGGSRCGKPELLKHFLSIEQMDIQYKIALARITELEGRLSRRDYLIDGLNGLLLGANIALIVPEATQEPAFLESPGESQAGE